MFIAIESFSAVAAVLVGSISNVLAAPFVHIAEIANSILLAVPDFFIRYGLAGWRLPAYSGAGWWIYALYLVPVIMLSMETYMWDPFALKRRFGKTVRRATLACSAALLFLGALIIVHPFSSPLPDGRLHVDFLDVGQGDSALITFPNGTTMLVDGGGRIDHRNSNDDADDPEFERDVPGIGEAVVSTVLWEKGYSRIDYILATHADADHIQGLGDVTKNFAVGRGLFGRTPPDDPEFAALARVLAARNTPTETLERGESIDCGGARLDVLWPEADSSGTAASDNNHSVVLRLTFGERSILLTGDIEQRTEAALLEEASSLRADVIKVPHHGSRTSSTAAFVDAVHPQYSVISVGRHSVFGHPHPEVVERWLASGSNVITTGERGMISISTNGKDLVVSTYR